MAEIARDWAILQNLQARLQTISIANGYRTEIGRDVQLERPRTPPVAPMITLYAGGRVYPQDAQSRKEREFTLVVEIRVPVTVESPNEMAVAADADVEQALDEYLPQPLALPLVFEESLVLEQPDGVPELVVQHMYSTRYRR